METDLSKQPLSTWLTTFERIYYQSQNHERDVRQILLRLFEAALNLHKAALKRKSYSECCETWLPKLVAWYAALTKQLGITELEHAIWRKFPGVCPFCLVNICKCSPHQPKRIDQKALLAIATTKLESGPVLMSLKEWQTLFDSIYQQSKRGLAPQTFSIEAHVGDGTLLLVVGTVKLYEELIELAEAIRLRAFYPENVRNELCDVFACICGIANILPAAFGRTDALDLGAIVWNKYPSACDTCGGRVCKCRPRLVRERLSAEGVREFELKDGLTGLYNREQFQSDLNRFFYLTPDIVIGQMYFDCDDFKFYNDKTAGKHAQGDEVLKHIAKLLEKNATPEIIPYRIGGDEFAVLLRSGSEREVKSNAEAVFNAIHGSSASDIKGGAPFTISISAGLSIRTPDMDVPDELSEKADSRLYNAKSAGKGRIVFD